ncbi:Membrane bound O-acyl transferase, MBOAT [Plasmopara halstedii]|uniref:Membrane bound O-acyl transferase, MBOAT n=1 Tax=Plasmopara halstedii TaxID=4781 RepID=A0A0P1AU35_PLAHL|nr:Membrane bound O-acyl transferase, MBOAT [Plasmopara halstedii]CEG45818.1 Membrane bound O-acyl transferase, MBOAT [Plasmopara halstedii]|eukprot:XP_024582187.1 Membrane bound O-acyl transferase, MBOAT [Plasmopara halstedii]
MASFFVSALWHGLSPGYYLFFLSGGIYIEVGKREIDFFILTINDVQTVLTCCLLFRPPSSPSIILSLH